MKIGWQRHNCLSIFGPVFLLAMLARGNFVTAQEMPSFSGIVINAKGEVSPPQALPFSAGGKSPDGHMLSANSRFLSLDGRPWFPVMGEFHYSRYPADQWEKEILKMKAGGIEVVSTYVFWIHHEEIEGQFDWSGQRNLRHFVELCAKQGLYVWVRVGPWDHGEVRNGGLPDWLVAKTSVRESNPVYLNFVRRFFAEIGKQLTGLFWKDGGRIIGVQLENEYSARGPRKGEDHILQLNRIARESGLIAPFYTVTGWDNAAIPSHDVLQVFGGYADGFWWRHVADQPPSPNYFFTHIRCEENVDDNLRSRRSDIDTRNSSYPFLTAEMGGGMANSYHRRPVLSADDTAAMEVVKLGSGVVLYGYYMFHGGTNPEGKKTTLQESQETGYTNDLPVKSYDFQAPLGEFGEMNPSYQALKIFHLFLGEFGSSLAAMPSYLPERRPKSKQDVLTPRIAARLQGDHGFIFINNHERTYHLPDKKQLQARLMLPSGVLDIPQHPADIPSDAYPIWPVNLNVGKALLRYATAQLLCKLDDPQTYVFFAWPGIAPEFAFVESEDISIKSVGGTIRRDKGVVYVDGIPGGTGVAIRIKDGAGTIANIVMLSREQALNTWKAFLAGKERLLLSPSQLYFDQDRVHVISSDPLSLRVGIFPALPADPIGFVADSDDGIFKNYAARAQAVSGDVIVQKLLDAGALMPVRMGNEVALVPDDSAFQTAASWKISLAEVKPTVGSNLFLQIEYEGDVARLYADDKLVTDNFYNGSPWRIGLDRIPLEAWDRLELKILPLREHAPIYLPASAHPAIPLGGRVARVNAIQVVPTYEGVMDLNSRLPTQQ